MKIMNIKLFFVYSTLACLLLFSLPTKARSFDCIEKDISDYQWRVRHDAALPAVLDALPNEEIQGCIVVKGVGAYPLIMQEMQNVSVVINEKAYDANSNKQIKDGDKITFKFKASAKFKSNQIIRLTFDETDKERRRKVYRIIWAVQTLNVGREPKTWHVGPSFLYREVKDVLPELVAGDTILLEAKATFAPFDARHIPGTRNLPITIKGDTKVAKNRPVIAGGSEKYNWSVSLRGSHFWTLENMIIQDGGLCFRNESHGITLKDVLIRRCSTGVLGTDLNSGSLTILNSEITESGGKELGRSWGHAIYAASDQHSFPDSLLTIKNSFIHNNKGNNIKSRFQNTLVEGNWIEAGHNSQTKYLIELIGYDGKYDFYGQQNMVRNNILFHQSPGLGSRVGGDGNSASRGDTVFEDNLFLIAPGFKRTIVRTFQGLHSLSLKYNTIAFINEPTDLVLITDEVENSGWVEGIPLITVEKNTFSDGLKILKRVNSDTNGKGVIIDENTFIAPILIDEKEARRRRPEESKYILGLAN